MKLIVKVSTLMLAGIFGIIILCVNDRNVITDNKDYLESSVINTTTTPNISNINETKFTSECQEKKDIKFNVASTLNAQITTTTYTNVEEKTRSETIKTTTAESKPENTTTTVTSVYIPKEVETTITSTSNIESAPNNNSYELPMGDNSFYAYMDYRFITDYNSAQYKLQQQAWTDEQGVRRVGEDVCIALGSYFSTNIGDRFLITLDSGNSYTAVLSDCKADYHTDYTNRYRSVGNGKINIIEFLVDTDLLDYSVKNSGSIGTYSNYSGNIISIEKINT